MPVSGVARNMIGDQAAIGLEAVVLYSTPALLAQARRRSRLQQPRVPARRHEQGRGRPDRRRRTALPDGATRPSPGSPTCPRSARPAATPARSFFDQLASIMNVFTVLALLAGLVLIANTMTTLIGEQRREIGMMKAIGGTRRQIRRVYLRTALLLGAAGSVIGVVLGARDRERGRPLLRLELLRDLARLRGRPCRSWSRASCVGLVAPPLAALPAIRRGSRIPVREGLEEVPALQGGQAAARPRAAPARASCRGRRRSASAASPAAARRSLTTVVQIALAVGTLLAVLALINTVTKTTNDVWNQARWDIELNTAVGTQFDARADRLIRTTPGVAQAQPMLDERAQVQGQGRLPQRLPRAAAVRDADHRRAAGSRRRRLPRMRRVAVIAKQPRAHDRHARRRHGDAADGGRAGVVPRRSAKTSSQWNNGTASTCRCRRCSSSSHRDTVNGYLIQTTSSRPRRDRPDDDPARGPARRQRLRHRDRGQVLEPAGQRQPEQGDLDRDRRPRTADRRDQHGRPRQRDHDERARADTRDRRAPLHRRPRPRHPPHLHRRGPRRLARRLAARDPGRLRARAHVQLAAAGGGRDRLRLHLPAAQPADRARRHRPARAPDHADPAPARRPASSRARRSAMREPARNATTAPRRPPRLACAASCRRVLLFAGALQSSRSMQPSTPSSRPSRAPAPATTCCADS